MDLNEFPQRLKWQELKAFCNALPETELEKEVCVVVEEGERVVSLTGVEVTPEDFYNVRLYICFSPQQAMAVPLSQLCRAVRHPAR